MSEDQVFKVRPNTLGKQRAGLFIGQMTMRRSNPLLERPRIRTIQEHLDIMIKLKNSHRERSQLLTDQRGGPAQIGDNAYPTLADTNAKRHRVGGVVGNSEGVDHEVANPVLFSRFDEFDVLRDHLRLQRTRRAGSHVEFDGPTTIFTEPLTEYPARPSVIRVLVSHEDRIDGCTGQAHLIHPAQDLLSGRTTVNQYAAGTIPNIGAVSPRTRREDRHLNITREERRHAPELSRHPD